MKAVGIVAEYNPLHNGHIYHMKKARDLSGADAVVVAVSGDFVQRGMPAVFDKWERARQALMCGADLVVEIPVLYCLGNAGQYAGAGVQILESLGPVTHIAFGSESGNADAISAAADFIRENAGTMRDLIIRGMAEGLNYPKARARAYAELGGPSGGILPDSPNDILALEYISAMKRAKPLAVPRAGAGYHDRCSPDEIFQSASGIREMIRNGSDISGLVPECTAAGLRAGQSTLNEECEARLFDLVRYAVMSRSPEWTDDCPSGGEGLGNLLRRFAPEAGSLDELILSVKSKRYTYTRLSRLCMQVLLGITRSEYYPEGYINSGQIPGPGYVRVLGFSDCGRRLLAEIRENESAAAKVITNINKEAEYLDERNRRILKLDVHAADIYSLAAGREIALCSDHRQRPVIISGHRKTADQ